MYPSLGDLGATLAVPSWRGLTPGSFKPTIQPVAQPITLPKLPAPKPAPRPVVSIVPTKVAPFAPAIPKPATEPVKRTWTLAPQPPVLLCATGWVNVGGKCVRREPVPITPRVAPPVPKPKLPPKANGTAPVAPPVPGAGYVPGGEILTERVTVSAPGAGGAAPAVTPGGPLTIDLPPWVVPVALGAVALLVFGGGRRRVSR